MAWYRKPPRLLPPRRALRGREDHPARQGGKKVRLQGNRELRRWTRGRLGNGEGEGSRPAHAADVHADTDLRVAPDRPRRANLKRTASYAASSSISSEYSPERAALFIFALWWKAFWAASTLSTSPPQISMGWPCSARA